MYCCANCFSDRFLKAHIAQKSILTEICSFCGTNTTPVIEPSSLSDRFQPLIDLYTVCGDEDGLFLYQYLQNDWSIFSGLVEVKQRELLAEICCGRIPLEKKYLPKIKPVSGRINKWNEFQEELKHINRYFPNNVPDTKHLEYWFGLLRLQDDEKPGEIFRARINKKGEKFELNDMGRPASETTSNGRANPLGISYLYAASDVRTAISEVRPYKGEIVTVARIQVYKDIEIADLRNPKHTISPFELEEGDLNNLYSEMPYLIILGEELSKPIIPREADLDYLPSQYLCEFVKHIGLKGVLYKSSLAEGDNIALFNDDGLNYVEKKEYIVVDNNIHYEELS